MIKELKELMDVMQDTFDRCEHCGKEGNVFDCDECIDGKTKLTSIMVDIVNQITPKDLVVRMEVLADILSPVISQASLPDVDPDEI